MKTKITIKKIWRRIRVFMIWMQLHHFKNFIMFWVRVGIILILIGVSVWVWFTDSADTIGVYTSIGCFFGALSFYMGGRVAIKRLNKKYVAYAKRLRAKITNIRSIF